MMRGLSVPLDVLHLPLVPFSERYLKELGHSVQLVLSVHLDLTSPAQQARTHWKVCPHKVYSALAACLWCRLPIASDTFANVMYSPDSWVG